MSTFLSFDFEVVVWQFMEINRRKHCRSFIRFRLSQQKGVDNKYVWNWYSSHNCSHLIPKIALDIQLKEHWHQGQFFIVCCNCLSMQLKYLSYNSVNCLLFITAMLHKNNRYHRFFQSEVCWTTPSLGAGESKWLMLLLWGRPLLLFRRSQVLDSRMSRSLSYHYHQHLHHHHHHHHLVALVEEVGGAGLAVAGLVLDTWGDVIY